ncbi:MAG: macro domain-containing protein [Deltaproteobacteria bacterium]|jgi:O-acetyl-ADP-ribose deacetylase (regulator of RNase III)|nr:macro domain-containing protein [Deltaproteobacteria bacterium]
MPIFIIYDDITQLPVDAVVNAANENLTPGGGICGAIFKGAGRLLEKDCAAVGHCPTGSAIITFGYKLKAKYVIHAVGPIWQDGTKGERDKLWSCYQEAMYLASTHDCESVAFPLISSGIYGYPKNEAFHVALASLGEYLQKDRAMNVFVSNFSQENLGLTPSERQTINAYVETGYNVPVSPGTDPKDRDLGPFKEFVLKRLAEEKLSQADAAKRANLLDKDLDGLLSYSGGESEPVPAKEKLLSLLTSLKADSISACRHLDAFGYKFDPQETKDKVVLYFLENGLSDVFFLNEAIHALTHRFLIDTDPELLVDKNPRRRR